MTIVEFWNRQQFSYLATYSFNRNSNLAALHEAITRVAEELEQCVASANFTQQFKVKRQLTELERQAQAMPYQKRLTNARGVIDSTADQMASIKRKSATVIQFEAIIKTTTSEINYAAGCIPIYRDAFAFYNEQDQLLQVLNVCFECLYMEADDGTMIEADVVVYDALRAFFVQLGHPIESVGG